MAERGAKLYVYLDELKIADAPDNGAAWTDTLTTSIPIEPGDDVYLLSVAYTTGNSLGRDPEVRHDCIDVYPTREAAADQAMAIRSHYNSTRNFLTRQQMGYEATSQVAIKLGSGEEMSYQGPWLGHFERVEEIEVARVGYGHAAVLKF